MEQIKKEQQSKSRKLLLVFPLLALPFLALAFWALGGGRTTEKEGSETKAGLNAALPDAHVPDDSAMDKMSFYEQEEKGSRGAKNDQSVPDSSSLLEGMDLNDPTSKNGISPYDYNGYQHTGEPGSWNSSVLFSEKAIRRKMGELENGMKDNEQAATEQKLTGNRTGNQDPYVDPNAEERLRVLMEASNGQEAPDPEMDKLQALMDRVYDIQHPDEVANKVQQQSAANRGTVYPVGTVPLPEAVHFLSEKAMDSDSFPLSFKKQTTKGFYGLNSFTHDLQTIDQGIVAVVQENTTVVNGASVKLRLLQDIYINGIPIPAGNFVTGQAQLSNDRVGITIPTVLYNQYILQVKLSAYDTDGMEGLYVPGSINREVVKQSGENAVQGLGVGTLDPSFGAQAAAAGIETAKTLFSRKLKLTKVIIKAGHKIILKDNQK